MTNQNLENSLKNEAIFFDQLISNRIKNKQIPLQADFRRATKFIPKDGDSWAEIIDPKMFDIVEGKLHKELLKRIINNGGNVLDICCGPGALSLELARNGLIVHGYDISQKAIITANKMLEENPFKDNFGQLKYHCLDVNKIDFENKKDISTIVGISAFHHIYELQNFLDNCYNSLKDDGLMVTLDDIGFTKTDYSIKNLLLFILPKYGTTYKEKFQRLFKYIFSGEKVSNEIFSPMEIWASKHDIASNDIVDFWHNKLKIEKVIYFGAFSIQVCNSIKGPDFFRYNVAKILTRLDSFLIKIGICRGFYRIMYATKNK